jgi:hypothetical protein
MHFFIDSLLLVTQIIKGKREHFDEKRAITPKWVIGFTSKLQGRKISTCCKFFEI